MDKTWAGKDINLSEEDDDDDDDDDLVYKLLDTFHGNFTTYN